MWKTLNNNNNNNNNNNKKKKKKKKKKKSHQKYKHLGYPSRKILETFLKVVKGRTSTNEPENKKTLDDA